VVGRCEELDAVRWPLLRLAVERVSEAAAVAAAVLSSPSSLSSSSSSSLMSLLAVCREYDG